MSKVFQNAYVRLAGRAVLAGGAAALTQLHSGSGTLAWKAAAVAGALAFAEVFTPLNSLIGVFKKPAA